MNRSAVTGRTVSNKKLAASPKTTLREERALKSSSAKSKTARSGNRSAVTGKSISGALTLTSSPFAFGGTGGTQLGLFNSAGGYTLEDQLVFTNIVANGGLSNVTASISTSAVLPEPASLTVMGFGMALLGMARRRRQGRQSSR